MTEDQLYESYQSARVSGQDGQLELAALYGPLRQHCEKVIWLTMRESSPDLAASVANEILHDIDKFRGDAKFSTWAHAIARNVACDEISKRKREVSLESLELETAADAATHKPYDRIYLQEICAGLDTDEQELVLARLHGETHEEIAERMGVEPLCIRQRWSRLQTKLKEVYNNGIHQ